MLSLSTSVSSFLSSFESTIVSLFFIRVSGLPSDSLNSPITSELNTVSPSVLRIFDTTPLDCASTSNTTLSVSISAITSSWFTLSPSFLIQLAIVPSATDSGKVGAFISILIYKLPHLLDLFVVEDAASSNQLQVLPQVAC